MKLYIGKYGCLSDRTVEFLPGLNIVTGGNGSGKSTLLEALLWAFYGDARIRLSDAQVEAEWEGINAFRSAEAGKTNFMVTLDGKRFSGVREGASVLADHGFPSLKLLLATVWSKQTELGFISLSPLERRRFIADVLELSKWDEARAVVKKKLSTLDSEAMRYKGQLETHQQEAEKKVNLVEQLEPLAALAKTTKRPELPPKVDTLPLNRLRSDKEGLERKTAEKAELEGNLPEEVSEEALGSTLLWFEEAQTALKGVMEQQTLVIGLATEVRQAKRARETLASIPCAETEFPRSCRFVKDAASSSVDVEAMEARVTALQEKNANDEKFWAGKQKQYEDVIQELRHRKHNRELALRSLASLSEVGTKLQEVTAEITRVEALVAAHDGEAEARHQAWVESSRYVDRIDNLYIEIGDYEQRIQKLQAKVETLEWEQAQLGQMEKDFSPKGVPGYLVECALPELADASNEYLRHFTDDYSVRFSMVKEKVTGGQSETLDILVSQGGEEVPIEGCSGGERVMVDIAIRMAVRDFVVMRGATLPNVLVLDETLAPLDEPNRMRFMQTFLSLTGVERVVLISHVSDVRELPGNVIHL